MSTWDAARAASRRQLPKPRKMHGPVGEWRYASITDQACSFCGHHVCSCKPVEQPIPVITSPYVPRDSVFFVKLPKTAFDDHVRHATEHALLAERMGKCGLCYSTEHKFAECPTMKAHLEALRMWR